ncbi:unnamed protein product [Paramecium octaurelia]|uniref:Uncharacterized protein n=1 Tax=Paramecium octaurelia TaxID=43137 RepID=A0A8S1RXT9_PAROT|nr:unnamed protein product [Paramecium octaurelia]
MQPDQIEEQKKKIQESEHNARKKEIELQFKNVFDEAKKILKREYYENEMSEKLRNLLDWIESDINKLSEKNDREFVKKYKSFVETYRSGLVEFKEILLNLKKIEENRQEIKKVKINSFKQNPQCLNTEIKFSEKRLQRMRAGVHLIQVLEESLARKYQETMKNSLSEQPIQQEPQQQMDLSETEIQIFQELENGFKKERISQTNEDLDKGIKKQKDIQIFDQVERALEEQKEKYQVISKEFDKGFQKQKVKCESIVKSSYKPVKGDLDFTNKYQDSYFKNYFREKFKLANYFLGDQLIKLFLHENQKYVNKVLNKNSNSSQQNSFNEKKIYNKELDPKNFIQQDDLESNGKALQKILKINEEIQKELLQDEHQRNIEEMNKIEIQKKQEHWEKVLQQDDHRKSTPNLMKKTSQVQLKKSQTVEKKTINIKPVISSLKKRTIYYQAHPNFPLISEVYKSHQNVPEERLKKAAIGYDIIQQPSRTLYTPPTNVNSQLENKNKVLKLEDDIYPQHPNLRVPRTAMQNFRGTFFPSSQHGLSRQNNQDYKSLTTLWGEQWNNY